MHTSVVLGAGEASVVLPANVPVRVHCHADLGQVDCLGQRGHANSAARGPGADLVVTDPGVNVPAGTRTLDLDVSVHTGHVEVRRG